MSLGVDDAARTERIATRPSLLDAVRDLRRAAEATRFPVELTGTDAAREARSRLLDQLDGHVVPRLLQLSAPAVVVVAGSTGVGKSTLVNSLLGAEVSRAGVLRPTTRRPVLTHHPEDGELLRDHPLVGSVDVVEHERVPRGLALLDAPDLDSLLQSNRETAHRLLEAADLWLFVTTATRYGDALPWDVIERALARGVSMGIVLNRVPSDALADVRSHLLGRLREHQMSSVPLFIVPDAGPHEGLLDPAVVAPINRWLTMLAGPDRARSVILRTLRGALLGLRPWVDDLAEAVQAQVDAAEALRRTVHAALDGPAAEAAEAVLDGAVAEGAVHARWVELTLPGGAFDSLVRRGRVSRRGREHREQQLETLLRDVQRSAVATVVRAATRGEAAVRAALQDAEAPDGAVSLLEAAPTGADADTAARSTVGAWVGVAEQTVRDRASGAPRRHPVLRAVRALGVRGVAAVALTAAAGEAGARDALQILLGADAAAEVVDRLVADLADRVREQSRAAGTALLAPLDDPDLAPDAAAVLRVRLAVLKDVS